MGLFSDPCRGLWVCKLQATLSLTPLPFPSSSHKGSHWIYNSLGDSHLRGREVKNPKKSVSVAHSRPTLCDHMDRIQPGSSVHRLLQARILEWIAIPFSRSSQSRDQTEVSCLQADSSPSEPPGCALLISSVTASRDDSADPLPFQSCHLKGTVQSHSPGRSCCFPSETSFKAYRFDIIFLVKYYKGIMMFSI